MGVPLGVIGWNCFLKAVPAEQRFVFLMLHFLRLVFGGKFHFPFAVLLVKLLFAGAVHNNGRNLESISAKQAVQSAYMYQWSELSSHSADIGCG